MSNGINPISAPPGDSPDAAKAYIFPDVGFMLRGTDGDHCWIDFFGPWKNGKREILFTRPGNREVWTLWTDRQRAQEAVLAFLAGKAHESAQLMDRVIRLENALQIATDRAPELAAVEHPGERMRFVMKWADGGMIERETALQDEG
jgi:hypothetical protein